MTGGPLPLRDYQELILEQAQDLLRADPSLLITAPTGAGKCHPEGTAIIMYDGSIRNVEDVRAGDQLMGPDSRPRRVWSTRQGWGPIVEIQPDSGEPWQCNSEHILTLAPIGEMGLIDLPLDQYRKSSRHFRNTHSLVKAKEISFPNPKGPWETTASPYMLGLKLGTKGTAGKPIPQRYRLGNIQERLEVLAGLLDASPHPDSTGWNFTAKSRQLAEDSCFIARSLGIAADMREYETLWKVSISGDTSRIKCRKPRKRLQEDRNKYGALRTGFTLRDLGEDRYYGFTLDGNGRYLLGDFTITHNTVVISEIAARAIQQKNRVGLLVHRQELVKQSREKISQQCQLEPGIVWQGTRQWDQPVTILAQDTLSTLDIPWDTPLDILMIDEAHHTAAPGWIRTIERLNPRYLVGFSATPFRQDKEPLSPKPFTNVIRPVTPQFLIDQRILCPARIESPIILDENGEMQPISHASNPENIYLQAIRYALGQGRNKILLYVSQTRRESPLQVIRKTTERLRAHGIVTESITQEVSSKKRFSSIERFQTTSSASVLINYMALTEGTDLPCVDCVVLGRRTESESTIIQMIGRGLRKHENKKDCLVLDYTGRPDMSDIINYWRLDGPSKEKEESNRERPKNNTPEELHKLVSQFPRTLNGMENTRIQYPWFKPFSERSLIALPLWSNRGEVGRYLTVEPQRKGGWRVTIVSLNQHGPSPIHREQTFLQTPKEAARAVRAALGEKAPQLERNARWRRNPPSEIQQKEWRRLNSGSEQNPADLTSGEIWDNINQERFQRRVNPSIL